MALYLGDAEGFDDVIDVVSDNLQGRSGGMESLVAHFLAVASPSTLSRVAKEMSAYVGARRQIEELSSCL